MISFVQRIVSTFLETVCCKYFLDTFLERCRGTTKWGNRIFTIIMMILFNLPSVVVEDSLFLKTSFSILILMGICFFYYKCTFLQNLFFSIIYYGIISALDFIGIIVLNFSIGGLELNETDLSFYIVLIALMCKTMLFVIVFLIRKRWNREESLEVVANNEWYALAYFPIITLISIVAMLFSLKNTTRLTYALIIVASGLVIMNLIVFYIIKSIIKKEKDIQNSRLMQERTKNQIKFYRNMNENYEKQRKKAHDYKNQLTCIQGLIAGGKFEETKEYIEELTGTLNKEVDLIDTNNLVVNSIINQKYSYAQSKDITMAIKVNDLSNIVMKEEDMVILLSNLLDNAIEACEKCKNKIIKVKIIDEKDQTIIAVNNPVEGEVVVENNRFITTKKDKANHGIGLLNIKSIVEKYNGISAIKCENGWFKFSALINHEVKS